MKVFLEILKVGISNFVGQKKENFLVTSQFNSVSRPFYRVGPGSFGLCEAVLGRFLCGWSFTLPIGPIIYPRALIPFLSFPFRYFGRFAFSGPF